MRWPTTSVCVKLPSFKKARSSTPQQQRQLRILVVPLNPLRNQTEGSRVRLHVGGGQVGVAWGKQGPEQGSTAGGDGRALEAKLPWMPAGYLRVRAAPRRWGRPLARDFDDAYLLSHR